MNKTQHRIRCVRHCAILLLIAVWISRASAQLANSPPTPQWLTVQPLAAGKAAAFEKRFEHSGKLLKAILLVAGESKTSVSLNGRSIADVESKERAVSLDVTDAVRDGANVLVLKSAGAVAVLLELNGDVARKQWIATDGTWKTSPGRVALRGAVDAVADANPFDLKKTFDAYNSWQLAKADQQNQATDASTFSALPGFTAELIRSATAEEGSWVSMAFDPQGRLTLAREKRGLLRLTLNEHRVEKVEVINDTLLECRGLLYAAGALFVNANNSKGLFRLRDRKGADQFDEVTELLHMEGGVGHGRNHIKLGPDGKIYVIHGNNVLLPKAIASTSPMRNYAPDQLIPNPWEAGMFDGNVELPAGHVLRMNPDGTNVELIAGGFRNPLDIAFNRDGELFTFDADMERDVGTAWYMPTRVLHVVPGADYGWRRGTGRFPAWFPDTLPSVIDVGLSSPAGVCFGYGAKFPAKYRDALFVCDWAYGRIIAIHLTPKGASYSGTQETLVSGRPMNVTDACIGPDGAMWFVTGGRGTQSGLYRLRYAGSLSTSVVENEKSNAVTDASLRVERKNLERLESASDVSDADLAQILRSLGSSDRFLSHAARVALEKISPARWDLASLKGNAWLHGAMALVHIERKESRAAILKGLHASLGLDALELSTAADQLRLLELTFTRLGAPNDAERADWLRDLERHFPTMLGESINREICRLLVYFRSPNVIAKTASLLQRATTSEDLVQYPLILRYVKDGWTIEARRVVFEALNRAEKMNGASSFFKAIQDIRSEMAASLTPDESQKLASVILPEKPLQLSAHAMPAHAFKEWKLDDLAPMLERVSAGRSFEKAKAALISTQCVFCHRVSNDPSLPAGVFGPDLSQVSSRFNRRDLLDQILNPSKVIDEKYRSVTVTLFNGKQVTGSVESDDDERLVLRPNPLATDKIEVAKSMIKDRKLSDVSPMPAGLLSPLKAEQILDMLAYFEAGGDPKHKVFQQPQPR